MSRRLGAWVTKEEISSDSLIMNPGAHRFHLRFLHSVICERLPSLSNLTSTTRDRLSIILRMEKEKIDEPEFHIIHSAVALSPRLQSVTKKAHRQDTTNLALGVET
jgi:hypothetical protein